MNFKKRLIFFVLLPALTGCIYKMPNEKTISTVPTVNNPQITRERNAAFPGMQR